MSEFAATATVEPNLSEVDVGKKYVPIEQRNDVTVDELERLSLPFPAELYDGRIVYKMPDLEHGMVQSNVIGVLRDYVKTHPIGIVASETNFRLWVDRPKESRIPDVCFIAKERVPKDKRRFPDMAPDLAVEIVSEDDSFRKIMEKVNAYLQHGTKVVWIIFASTREVLVCTSEGKHYVRDVLTAPEVLPDFTLSVEEIFAGVDD